MDLPSFLSPLLTERPWHVCEHSNCSLPKLLVVRTKGRCHATPRFGGLHALEENIELLSQSIEFRLRSFLKRLEMIYRNQDCPWRVVLSDQDSRPLDRLLEQTSKLVLSFGRCVGGLCSAAVDVARTITLLLRRRYLLGCVRTLHKGILAIMAKRSTGFVFASGFRHFYQNTPAFAAGFTLAKPLLTGRNAAHIVSTTTRATL